MHRLNRSSMERRKIKRIGAISTMAIKDLKRLFWIIVMIVGMMQISHCIFGHTPIKYMFLGIVMILWSLDNFKIIELKSKLEGKNK